MGKLVVASHKGQGEYTVKVALNNAPIDARIAKLGQQIVDMDVKIADMPALIEQASEKARQASDALSAAIAAYRAATESAKKGLMKEMQKKNAEFTIAISDLNSLQSELAALKLERAALQLERDKLSSGKPIEQTVDVWCADYTLDLSGDIGSYEILPEKYGKESPLPIIAKPGFDGKAAYDAPRDGILTHPLASGPSASYWNLGALPAWEKWLPIARVGKITAIAGDLCDVLLDAATSSRQNLDVNRGNTLTGVPISYMTCNGGAFLVDDRVVVEFTDRDWTKPKVVGFESHPRPCSDHFYIMWKVDGDEYVYCREIRQDGSIADTRKWPTGVINPLHVQIGSVNSRGIGFAIDADTMGHTGYIQATSVTIIDTAVQRDVVIGGFHVWAQGSKGITAPSIDDDTGDMTYFIPAPDQTGEYSYGAEVTITLSPYSVSSVPLESSAGPMVVPNANAEFAPLIKRFGKEYAYGWATPSGFMTAYYWRIQPTQNLIINTNAQRGKWMAITKDRAYFLRDTGAAFFIEGYDHGNVSPSIAYSIASAGPEYAINVLAFEVSETRLILFISRLYNTVDGYTGYHDWHFEVHGISQTETANRELDGGSEWFYSRVELPTPYTADMPFFSGTFSIASGRAGSLSGVGLPA